MQEAKDNKCPDKHECQYCLSEFSCTNPQKCKCLQIILRIEDIARLVWYCSDDCFDEDFPPPNGSEDDNSY